ncbi:hypothetical protein [Nocardiopsis ansamitocini]|uniref:Uncharacterized protein n=1 Tax=Nocardiopsis ansamitocini TaxID=1670832 RepID=A0A9W6UH99_9ACTN|nr:hypothetical protein [Nocardiopsis ansamitocini]GLU46532.1 hypothetical protein Nans01_08830 [Nocardiopsis ansamitocini]
MKRHLGGVGVNHGVVAGTVNGAVQNNPFAHGSTQVNQAAGDPAAILTAARTQAGHVRDALRRLAADGDRDACLALDDLAEVTARLTPPVTDHGALHAGLDRLVRRCAVLPTGVDALGPLREAVEAAVQG